MGFLNNLVAETLGGISELTPGAPPPAAPPPIPSPGPTPPHEPNSPPLSMTPAWGPASRTAPAAYDGTGDPAQHGDIGVETDFRDGHLRHDDLKKPLTSQL